MPVQVKPVDSELASIRFTTVSAPATGDAHFTCATTRDGKVFCLGNARGPQSVLGIVSGSMGHSEPTAEFMSPDGAPFTNVATGFDAICALTARGAAFCWGNNELGQLGIGSTDRHSMIAPVAGGHRFQKLSMGRDRACGISDAHRLYCWGSGLNGALGTDVHQRCAYQLGFEKGAIDTAYAPCAREPVPVMPQVPVRDVAVGDDHGCALGDDGAMYCWGYVYDIDFHEPRPTRIAGVGPLVALTSGSRHVCGTDAAGQAYCWGRNWRGQLGQPAPKNGSRDLMRVAGGIRFLTLSAGDDHTCGLTADHRAYCWGDDEDRQLGTGAVGLAHQEAAIPSQVAGTLRFTAIGAGGRHTCAVSTQGSLFCWGTSLAVRPGLDVLKEEPEPFLVAGPH